MYTLQIKKVSYMNNEKNPIKNNDCNNNKAMIKKIKKKQKLLRILIATNGNATAISLQYQKLFL